MKQDFLGLATLLVVIIMRDIFTYRQEDKQWTAIVVAIGGLTINNSCKEQHVIKNLTASMTNTVCTLAYLQDI